MPSQSSTISCPEEFRIPGRVWAHIKPRDASELSTLRRMQWHIVFSQHLYCIPVRAFICCGVECHVMPCHAMSCHLMSCHVLQDNGLECSGMNVTQCCIVWCRFMCSSPFFERLFRFILFSGFCLADYVQWALSLQLDWPSMGGFWSLGEPLSE